MEKKNEKWGERFIRRGLDYLSYEQLGLVLRSRGSPLESFVSPLVVTSGFSSSSSSRFWLLQDFWLLSLWCYQYVHSTYTENYSSPPTSSSLSCRLYSATVDSIRHLCLFIIKCEGLQEYWPILVPSYESILLFIHFLPERLLKDKTRLSELVNVCTSVVLLSKNIIREDVSSTMVLSNGVNNPCPEVSIVNAHLTFKHKISGAVVMTEWKPQSNVMAKRK